MESDTLLRRTLSLKLTGNSVPFMKLIHTADIHLTAFFGVGLRRSRATRFATIAVDFRQILQAGEDGVAALAITGICLMGSG